MEQKGTIQKRIALTSLVMPEEIVRKGLNPSRIKMFEEKYREGHQLPPIKAMPLQNGDPKKITYLMTGGFHRFDALNTLGYKETDVLIDITHTITPGDLDTQRTKNILATAQVIDNAAGSLQHTEQELRDYARKNYLRGDTVEEIEKNTGYAKRTVQRWIADLADEKKKGKRIEALKMYRQDKPVDEITKELNIPRSTLFNWLNETLTPSERKNRNPKDNSDTAKDEPAEPQKEKSPKNDTCHKLDFYENQPPEQATTPPAEAHKGETTQKNQQPTLFYDPAQIQALADGMDDYDRLQAAAIFLTSLTPNKRMQQEILRFILPRIAQHFPGLQKKTIKSIDYAYKAELLEGQVESLKTNRTTLNRQLSDKQKEVDKLKADLKKRKTQCKMSCRYTMERMEHEEEKYIKETIDDIKEVSLVLCGHVVKMKERQVTPLQRKLHDYLHGGQHTEAAKDIARQIALNSAYSLASQLESCIDQGILYDKVDKYLDEAKKRLTDIGIIPGSSKDQAQRKKPSSRSLTDHDACKNLYHRFGELQKKKKNIITSIDQQTEKASTVAKP